jgi:hypothetical protein
VTTEVALIGRLVWRASQKRSQAAASHSAFKPRIDLFPEQGEVDKEANVVLQSDKMKDVLAHLGIGPVGGSPAKMAERIAQEADLYKGIISSRQISVQ